jgi:hypothetical protein
MSPVRSLDRGATSPPDFEWMKINPVPLLSYTDLHGN